jgi:hypothetical protein
MPVNIGDAVDGVLVSAIGLAGRRIGVCQDAMKSRFRYVVTHWKPGFITAGWFHHGRMAKGSPVS